MTDISKIAALLGRRGGQAKSKRKAAAGRENGKLGGRPLKYCPKCADEDGERSLLVGGTCGGCGSYFPNSEGVSL
jgi:hypothetical protein